MKHDKERKKNLLNWLDFYKQKYLETKNSVYAWRGYCICRDANFEIPEWIFSYLDRCAGKMWDLTGEYVEDIKKDALGKTVCKVFNINKKSITDAKKAYKDMKLCIDLLEYVIAQEICIKDACLWAEKKSYSIGLYNQCTSQSSYRRAWINSGHMFIDHLSSEKKYSKDSNVYKAFHLCNKWNEIKHYFKNSASF